MKSPYAVTYSHAALVSLHEQLPTKVAFAALEFINGPLAENPHRLGKPLRGDLAGKMVARRGEYRVLYEIVEHKIMIEIVLVSHRRTAYRRRSW